MTTDEFRIMALAYIKGRIKTKGRTKLIRSLVDRGLMKATASFSSAALTPAGEFCLKQDRPVMGMKRED